MRARLRSTVAGWFEPVDAASIAVFRIALGTMVLWDVARYWAYGWIHEYYIRPKWFFPYLYFEWVRPLPGDWMYVHFAALGVAALCVALGLFYRPAIIALWVLYTWKFLIDKSVYMNHYYLIGLLCFLLIWMQPQRAFSLDRRRHPEWSATVPFWNVLLLRFQLFIVYFFGAIAKLNPDWLRGEPMYSSLLHGHEDVPGIASHFPPALLAYAIAYGGILFDFAVPILLCFRRTRLIGFLMAAVFHLLNDIFLSIGVFSYLMTAAITIFFDPSWPRPFLADWGIGRAPAPQPASRRAPVTGARRGLIAAGIAAYVLVQIALPLRHFLYPGYVSWTEEGHRFAWHMKLRGKTSRLTITGYLPSTRTRFRINPEEDLTPRQVRKLYTFPDMLLQYVHYKRDELRAMGADPIITASWECSLNGAPAHPLVDPTVDLAKVEPSIWPASWIIRERKFGNGERAAAE